MTPFRFALAALLLAAAPATAQDAPVRTAALNGIEMAYRDIGTGAPLVLLHGFGGCADDWEPFVGTLSARYRLILPEQRGHGHSTNPGGEFTHRQSASDVFALLDALGIERFTAMGISSGGMTLLHMATREPARVEALVLIGATPYYPEQARAVMRGSTPENLPDDVRQAYRDCAARGEAQADELMALFLGLQHSYDDMTFTPPHLATIRARTLIVHGDRDFFFPVEIPVEMYRAIPEAELWIVPGGGHVPIYDPAVPFAATALRFLGGGEGASP